MSIQSEIDRIEQNVANTYAALSDLGADMPTPQNSDNLAQTVGNVKAVLYIEQTLTEEQQAQARGNIGAASQNDLQTISDEIVDLSIFVTPQMFGAKADGETDDSDAIQSALSVGGAIRFPAGDYLVTTAVCPISDSRIVFERGARLIEKSYTTVTEGKNFTPLELTDVENTTIVGGVIECTPIDLGSEYSNHNAVSIRNCKNLVIDGMTINNSTGNGIFLWPRYKDGNYYKNYVSNGVTIRNCSIVDFRCNGVVVDTGENIYIENCFFRLNETTNSFPMAAIDIERGHDAQNYPGEGVSFIKNIVVRDCVTYNSTYCINGTENYKDVIFVRNVGGLNAYSGSVEVHDCIIRGTYFKTSQKLTWDVTNLKMYNCTIDDVYTSLSGNGNCEFYNCRFSIKNQPSYGFAMIFSENADLESMTNTFLFESCTFEYTMEFSKVFSFIYGIPRATFKNCNFRVGGKRYYGLYGNNNRFEDCNFEFFGTKVGSDLLEFDGENNTMIGCSITVRGAQTKSLIHLEAGTKLIGNIITFTDTQTVSPLVIKTASNQIVVENVFDIVFGSAGGNIVSGSIGASTYESNHVVGTGGYLPESQLSSAIDTALAQAKESGEFDGPQGPKGDPYTLTDADKTNIVNAVISALPVYDGGVA